MKSSGEIITIVGRERATAKRIVLLPCECDGRTAMPSIIFEECPLSLSRKEER